MATPRNTTEAPQTQDEVTGLAARWNLTEEMARQPWLRGSNSPTNRITGAPDMKAAALWYAKKGIPVFPLHCPVGDGCSCCKPDCKNEGKHPHTEHGFQDATTDPARIAEWWQKWRNANIGVPTGALTGLLVVDVDPRNGGDDSLEELLVKHGSFPETPKQVTGGGGRHFLFGYDGGRVPKNLADGIDLKGDGGYIVVAPSLHKSGNRYRWDSMDGPNAILKPAELPAWIRQFITDSTQPGATSGTVSRELPEIIPDGQKHNTIISLSGTLNKRGAPREAAFAACRALNFASPVSDADISERVESIYKRYPQHVGEAVNPGGRGEPDRAVARAEAASNWPTPEPIQSELPPVAAFSEDLLPVSFRPLVRDVAERMQVPIDYPAAVTVICLAGAVNRRAVIQPKASDTSWVAVPNLWGGIIGPPGIMKSPLISAVTRPLNQIQTEWRLGHEESLKNYALGQEEYDLQHSVWKDQYKVASKKGNVAPDRPEGKPEEPKLRRLIVNDATFEALHQTMSEKPAGILVIRDELTGWWSQLDRAAREGERAFCLQAWNGDTGHTIDRIGRGTIHVEACCMSMLGGIQPGRLRSYLVDALADGPSNDGLIQRFQILVWPDIEPNWTYVDRTPNVAAEQMAALVFRKLVELDGKNPARFRFAPEAQELFVKWLTNLELTIRANDLHPALIAHLSKYRSLMPSLALLFELADRVGSVGFVGSSFANTENFVNLDHTRQAVGWCEYLETQARRVYSCIVTPQLRAARELADRIKNRKVGTDGFFSCREVYLKGWTGLDNPDAVKQAIEVLQDAKWLREVPYDSKTSGGRPSNRYQVNPRVWE